MPVYSFPAGAVGGGGGGGIPPGNADAFAYYDPFGLSLSSDAAFLAKHNDAFGRPNIWDTRSNGATKEVIWRQGAWEADGDPFGAKGNGAVFYGSNALGAGPNPTDGGYFFCTPHSFGVYEIIPGVNGGNTFLECGFEDGGPEAPFGYNGFFVNDNLNASIFAVVRDPLGAFVGVGALVPSAGERFRVAVAAKFDAQIAFFAGAPQSQVTVLGSRGGNAALASLISALAAAPGYNLIIDGTSP